MYQVGFSKKEMHCFKKNTGMYGYGMHFNVAMSQATTLHTRAMCIKELDNNSFLIISNSEICFITHSVRRDVLKRLKSVYPEAGYTDDNIMLTSSHTHSGPGGYNEYPMYNITVPGFHKEILDGIVSSIVEAIVEARTNLKNAKIEFIKGAFDKEIKIGYNRSLKSYNSNPEVEKIPYGKEHLAFDRTMYLIKATEEKTDNPIGQINWFGMHGTSIGNKNTALHYDNKGFASEFFENYFSEKEIIGIFAQGVTGDVSPNYHGPNQQKKVENNIEKQIKKAEWNGEQQFLKAKDLFESNKIESQISGSIDVEIIYKDFSKIKVLPEYVRGSEQAETTVASHGMAFLRGTPIDGKGAPDILAYISIVAIWFVKQYEMFISLFMPEEARKEIRNKYRIQGKKNVFIEGGARKILGTTKIDKFVIPNSIDPVIGEFKKEYINGGLSEHTWVPHILPFQICIIGSFAIVGIPCEITTIASKRLKDSLFEILKKRGVDNIIISPYSNDYMGYITTSEEYDNQSYEGGHTMFGRWSLGAMQTILCSLASEMLKEKKDRNLDKTIRPPEFSEAGLKARTY